MFKILKYIIVTVVSLVLIYFGLVFLGGKYVSDTFVYGTTFSKTAAESYNLDWKEAYLALLDDLGVKNIRIPVYWSEIERNKGEYDFSDYDWQVEEAAERGVQIILAVGHRVPRWPECHAPAWAHNLSDEERQEYILAEIEAIIEHFKEMGNVWAWQVENEPFLKSFGECPSLDKDFLDKEISLVRSLDNRPIIMTASGELSRWGPPAERSDIFGTSIYRTVKIKYIGLLTYPLRPSFFRARAGLLRLFTDTERIIAIEAQAEPWGLKSIQEMTDEEQMELMGPEKFQEHIQYFEDAGFGEIYLWGAEWWYWRKVNGDDTIWEEAKKVFSAVIPAEFPPLEKGD